MRVVIAEGDALLRAGLVLLLRGEGLEVVAAVAAVLRRLEAVSGSGSAAPG